jgi:hypothetical protein
MRKTITIGRTSAVTYTDAETGREPPLTPCESEKMAAVVELDDTAQMRRIGAGRWYVWIVIGGSPEIIGEGEEPGQAADDALSTIQRWRAARAACGKVAS